MKSDKIYTDFYDLFGLPTDADKDKIKSRTNSMIKKFHPDLSDDEIAATPKQFKTLKFAKSILLDEDKRKEYDKLGHNKFVKKYGENKINGFKFEEKRSIMNTEINSTEVNKLIKNDFNNVHSSNLSTNKQIKMKPDNIDNNKTSTNSNNTEREKTSTTFLLIYEIINSKIIQYFVFSIFVIILLYTIYVLLGLIATLFTIFVCVLLLFVYKKL